MGIQCRNLQKTYSISTGQIKAVDKVDLKLHDNDFAVILGHSGSGKTTLLSLIGGLTRPDSGTVLINGQESWQQSDSELTGLRNEKIGFIFQFASLIPALTVIENIMLPLSFSRQPAGNRDLALSLLEQVELEDKTNIFPAQLSGGQQRRVAIARAFINQPAIILADEPTGDLDEETEGEILSLFRRYHAAGTTFVVVTHNSALAGTQKIPRIFDMRQGVLEERTAVI